MTTTSRSIELSPRVVSTDHELGQLEACVSGRGSHWELHSVRDRVGMVVVVASVRTCALWKHLWQPEPMRSLARRELSEMSRYEKLERSSLIILCLRFVTPV